MKHSRHIPTTVLLAVAAICLAHMKSNSETTGSRGAQFISFESLATFEKTTNESGAIVMTSPDITARISWNELIVSWNAEMPTNAHLKIESRGIQTGHTTKFYTMGLWTTTPSQQPSESVPGQKDDDGDMLTDTLVLNKPAGGFQLRLTLTGDVSAKAKITFLGVSLVNTKTVVQQSPPNRKAWSKTLPVPERSQMAYENGVTLCSPTTVSMLLSFWAKELKRPELERDVPEVSANVFDPNWPGTGNWSFNMAYAGSFPGMRAYVTRLTDVSELEDRIAAGIPVGLSVCYNRLRGKSREPSGHVVVLCGFTETGDAIINDPGTSKNVRKIFPRANLIDAWSYSKNTVYLIYPTTVVPPIHNQAKQR